MAADIEAVVLVHGLFMRGAIMLPLALQLELAGYETHLFSYPTRAKSPAENAVALRRFIHNIATWRMHVVAHSLGGLVLRHAAAQGLSGRFGRAVTLGTPHRASATARLLARFPAGRQLLNRSLERGLLGDDLPPWPRPLSLGSVAGMLPVGLGRLLPGLPQPNDGTVAVEETRLEGMTDHIVMPVSHTGLLLRPAVAAQVASFLRHGHFQHDAAVKW
ncbi:MAG TPA: alpha/beta hydrolase [Gammaproteobacteria bacterium]|nr:alpha/beta hydrolase [Gammaproteobacteria bacterium]